MSAWGWVAVAFAALPWVYVLMRLAGKGWAKSYYEELRSILKK